MKVKFSILLVIASVIALLVGPSVVQAKTNVGRASIDVFQAAGALGGGPLTAGDTFPATNGGHSTLQRGENWVQYQLHSSGLPAGAYTNWWVVFRNPEECENGCGEDDLGNEDVAASVFWATGGIVQPNGIGNFQDRYTFGDDLGEPGAQHLIGDGVFDPKTAEIHLIVKYHGPASDDADTLVAQTTTFLGGCDNHANAILGPDSSTWWCFDPQASVHVPE